MSSNHVLNPTTRYRVGVLEWFVQDGIAEMIANELTRNNQVPLPFTLGSPLPNNIDVLFTYGPFGKTLPIWQQAATRGERRPIVVHWNTEGMPDLRVPLKIMQVLGKYRSDIGQMGNSNSKLMRMISETRLFGQLDRTMHRWRYWGDYQYAYQKKWLHILADSSVLYSRLRAKAGVPTLYVPWGGTPEWYANLNLERDIDVLWLGKRGSSRRSKILDQVVGELRAHGVKVHMADSEESPFIFNQERTEYLNRAKVTLNITRTWFDDNFSRFAIAAPNRSLIISEPLLPHCTEYIPGVHYVSASIPELCETILYYLKNESKKETIVENAYQLTTQELAFSKGIHKVLDAIVAYQLSHP